MGREKKRKMEKTHTMRKLFSPDKTHYLFIALVIIVGSIILNMGPIETGLNEITGNVLVLDQESNNTIDEINTNDISEATTTDVVQSVNKYTLIDEAIVPEDARGVYTIIPSFRTKVDFNLEEYNEISTDAKKFLEEVDDCKKTIITPDDTEYDENQDVSDDDQKQISSVSDKPESIKDCVTIPTFHF